MRKILCRIKMIMFLQWEQFLTEYYSITQGGAKIQARSHLNNNMLWPYDSTFNMSHILESELEEKAMLMKEN